MPQLKKQTKQIEIYNNNISVTIKIITMISKNIRVVWGKKTRVLRCKAENSARRRGVSAKIE